MRKKKKKIEKLKSKSRKTEKQTKPCSLFHVLTNKNIYPPKSTK